MSGSHAEDFLQVDGLVGAKEVLKLVPEKAVFLSALHPRDCLRLLGVVSSFLLTILLHYTPSRKKSRGPCRT